MKQQEFANLNQGNMALIDTTCLRLLTEPLLVNLLSAKRSDVLNERLLQHCHLEKEQVITAIDILARVVAYDVLVVDEIAWDNTSREAELPDVFLDVFAVTRPGKTTYEIAAHNVVKFGEATGLRPEDNAQEHPLRTTTFWDPHQKRFHDYLAKEVGVEQLHYPSWVMHSDKSPARVLFYLELADQASVPVILSPDKRRFFPYFREKLLPEFLRLVQQRADQHLFGQMTKILTDTEYAPPRFALPPLPEYIVKVARTKNLSVFESALWLRELPEAKDFRKWAGEIQRLLLSGDRASYATAQQRIMEMDSYFAQWEEAGDPKAGIRWIIRKLDLESIPKIGWLLKLAGLDQQEVKDPVLFGVPSYIQFVSEWFDDPSRRPDEVE